jgi:hypothetical protein
VDSSADLTGENIGVEGLTATTLARQVRGRIDAIRATIIEASPHVAELAADLQRAEQARRETIRRENAEAAAAPTIAVRESLRRAQELTSSRTRTLLGRLVVTRALARRTAAPRSCGRPRSALRGHHRARRRRRIASRDGPGRRSDDDPQHHHHDLAETLAERRA